MSEMRTRRWSVALSALALVAVLALALGLRLNNLVPPQRGMLYAADADEGIYAASARLALDGYLPYRDFFCSAPPVGLYLFMAVLAPTSQPWGDSSGFMALRYASVVYGMITIIAVYAIASRLGGRGAGLLAAALLAMDGWAVAQDRRAMLESPMNMFSALALLALVVALQRQSRSLRWYALAGALAALAILSKTQGMVMLAVLLLTLIAQRQWRPMLALGCAAASVYLLLSLPYLLSAADDFVRQLIAFQFLRPANGDPALMLRVNAIRNYPEAWLTVRLGLAGAGLLLVRWLWEHMQRFHGGRLSIADAAPAINNAGYGNPAYDSSGWLPVVLWAALVAASFAASKTFYLYYYAQLAVPLALLGGSLLQRGFQSSELSKESGTLKTRLPIVAIALAIAALVLWRGPTELRATIQGTRWVKPAYTDAGQFLKTNTPGNTSILAFEPNYAFLGERPLARLADGTFFVDTHAYMLYLNLSIKTQSWPALLGQIVQRATDDEQTILWRQPAQDVVLATNAQYTVIDRRARYLLAPQTLATLAATSRELVTLTDVTVSQVQGTK
jgi:hypothetical protein